MIRLLPKDLFKKELLKTIFILAGIFILATIVIIFFRGYYTLEKFRKTSHLDELIIEKDFYMIDSIYPSQLEYLKNEIKQIGLNNKKLELYFHSHRALLPNQSNVNSLIVTNKERKIIYSDLHWTNDDESNLEEKKYLKSLEDNPNQIIFSNFTKIISESPSGNFTIPIATGIVDNNNLFIGAIIVHVSTGNFSKNVLGGDLFSISISDKSVITNEFWDSSYFRKMWVLLFSNQKISKIFDSKYINKQINLKYQPNYHRQKFIKKTIEGCIITFLILLIIFIFYYFNILNPLRPTLSIMNHLHDNGLCTFNRNLFNIVTSSLTKQSEIISEQQARRNDQLLQFSTLVSSIGSMTNYIKTKLDFLIEDIESAILTNQKDINSVMVSFNHVITLLSSQKKEDIDIKSLLIKSGIKQELFIEEKKNNRKDIEKMNYYQVKVYDVLFNILIQEILGFTKDARKLKSVQIGSNSQVTFNFAIESSCLTLNDNEKLTLCKLWALFNDIQITVEYNVKNIKIVCHM